MIHCYFTNAAVMAGAVLFIQCTEAKIFMLMNITYNTLICVHNLMCTRQLTIPHTITINSIYFQHSYPQHVPVCHKQYIWQMDLQFTPFPDLNSPYKQLHTCTSDSDIPEVPVWLWLVMDQPSLHPYNFAAKFWLIEEIKTKHLIWCVLDRAASW